MMNTGQGEVPYKRKLTLLQSVKVDAVFYCPEVDANFTLTQVRADGSPFADAIFIVSTPETLGEKHMKEVLS